MKYQIQLIRIAATFILFVLLTATFLPTSAQTIRRVTTAGDAGADGSTWEASMTLQAALAASDSLDQVWIAGGTYKPHATDRDTTFNISAGVLVYGGFDPVVDATDTDASSRSGEATILSGDLMNDDLTDRENTRYAASRDDNSRTVVTLAGANVTLNGLTISAGERGTAVVSVVTLHYGAGLYAGTGTAGAVVQRCTFTNNSAGTVGGGAYFTESATLAGCTFTNNSAGNNGGGAYFTESATLTGCTFSNNNTDNGGGGGAIFLAEAMLANCVFASNSSSGGGGAVLFSGGTVINSTFYNNSAGGSGISVAFLDADPDMDGIQTFPFNLQNSILIDNTASGSSSGGHQVYVGNTDAANVVNINYNLIEGGASNIVFANAQEPAVEVNNIRGASDGDEATLFMSITSGDENFLRLADNTLALNAGFNDYVNNAMPAITTDAAGNDRIQGVAGSKRVDLGAYESAFETFVQAPQTVTFTLDSVGVVGVELDLTGTTSSGLAITFTSLNTDVAEVGTGEQVGKLIPKAMGTATITASLGATTDFMAATAVTRTIMVRNPIIRRVTTTGDAGNDGSSWANAMTLQAALSATSALRGDQVWIAAGTYNPVTPADSTRTTTEERETTFSIQADAVVYGGFAGDEASFTPDNPTTPANEDSRSREVDGTFTNETILSGDLLKNDLARPDDPGYDAMRTDNSRTVVTLAGANVTLNGLTITAGEYGTFTSISVPRSDDINTRQGAGLYANSSIVNASLVDCTFTGNRTTRRSQVSSGGGGAYFGGDNTSLVNCTFTNNSSRGNYSSHGGGAYFGGDNTSLTSCTFTNNNSHSFVQRDRYSSLGGGAYFGGGTTTLTDCTFTGNNTSARRSSFHYGGGAYFGGVATLVNCTFTGNHTNNFRSHGGGAYFPGTATLTGCTFTDNNTRGTGSRDSDAGGAYFGGVATLTACAFTNNRASRHGGGACFEFDRAVATLTDCTFTNNMAEDVGGGVAGNGGFSVLTGTATVMLTNCTLTGNSSQSGGGTSFTGGDNTSASLVNCVFANNRSSRGGGAYFGDRIEGTIINTTFYNNSAGSGGGFRLGNSSTSITLRNSILIDNIPNHISSPDGNRTSRATIIEDNLIGGGLALRGGRVSNTVVENDAVVVFESTTAEDTDFLRLKDGSPAVHAGNDDHVNNAVPPITTDAAGNPRIQGGRVDLGAYESAFTKSAQTITFTSPATGEVGNDITLTATATSGLDVTFAITAEVPATGDGTVATLASDTLMLTGAGTVTVTASQAGNGTYEEATAVVQTITVTKRTQAITFTLAAEGEVGENITLAATASSGLDVTFEITEELLLDGSTATTGAVATLARNTLRLTGVGTVEVTASQTGNETYEEATAVVQELTVSKQTQTLTFTSDTTGTVGMDIELMATASSGLPVTFMITEGNTLATLADNTLSLTGVGTVEITATQAGNANYAAATQTQTITVEVAVPTIRRVTTTGAGTGDGSSWANAMMLQAALRASTTAGDQVWIAEGTYKPHADDRAATFSISTGVLVYGGFAGTEADDFDPANNLRTGSETILSGDLSGDDIERPAAGSDQTAYDASRDDNSHTVVTVSGADLTLDGLTISGGERGTEEDNFGNTKYYGAGLYGGFRTGVLTLQNIILRSNNAEHEGGGAYFKSTVSVTNATFTNNTATEDGGGAYFKSITTITGSTFSNNRTSDGSGGGAYFGSVNIIGPNISSVATVTNSTFTNNSVSDVRANGGGGAYFDGSATVTGCTFSNNTVTGTFTSGGGAYFDDDATVVNCVFANNRVDGNGGGAYFFLFFGNINSTVTNSTFYSNSGNQGGGIYANYGLTSGSNINLRNNILMNNTANAGAAELYINTQNASQTASIDNNLIQGGNNEPRVLVITDDGVSISNIVDASDAAVVFASTDSMNANYLRLKAGSPALNAGNNDYLNNGTPGDTDDDITTDAAGNDRIQDGTVDLGAYEGVVKSQTITFTLATTSGTVGARIPLAATTDATGLFVTFSIETTPATGVATLTDNGDGTGTLTLVSSGAGTVTVTASQAGNANYAAATPVERTITVNAITTGTEAVDDLVLYPNPTSGKLHFSEQVEEFLLYSSEGRLLDTWKNVRSADLTALPSGMYFVEVIRGGRSVGYRIVRK